MHRHRYRATIMTAATLILLVMLTACTSDEASHSIGAAMRSWCQNSPDHCSLAADSR